jgi:hypothetical protein
MSCFVSHPENSSIANKMTVLEFHNGYYLWKFLPSTPAAVAFLLLFIVTTALHTCKMIKNENLVLYRLHHWRLLHFSLPSSPSTPRLYTPSS